MHLSNILNTFKSFFSSENLLENKLISQNQKTVIIISLSLIVLAILLKIYRYLKLKNHKINQKLADMIFTWLVTVSIISLFLLFCNWQGIVFLSYLFWWYLLILTFVVWGAIILTYRFKKFPYEASDFEDLKRKEKYLPKPKR